MVEALNLAKYLPISFKSKSEQDYLNFLWEAFESNYANEKYEFASLAFHLLYMSFVSFSIWQIRTIREQDFKNALVGFQSDNENYLLEANTPFKFYDKLKESQIFRFLKLIGCNNAHVGEFAKFVKRRNKIAHPSGNVFFNDKMSIDDEISEIMCEVENIQQHMKELINELYRKFLVDSGDIEKREYLDNNDQIEAELFHHYYVSTEDLSFIEDFDITLLVNNEFYEEIRSLHESVLQKYKIEND